jgi:YbbR domain-containing protein
MGAPEPGETEVVVSGPAEKIALATQAVGSVNVEGRTDSVDQAIRLEPRDDNGNLVEKLTIEPPLMNVVIEIEQTTFSRPVTVSPDVTGAPADGYNIVSASANPAIVVIRGDQASIGEMTTISTQPVDVEGEDKNIVRSVSLQLPQGISVLGSPNVTVTVRIEPAEGTVQFGVPLTVRSLGAGLSVADDLPPVEVTLKGALPDLLELTSSDVVAFVDLTGKDAGTHNVRIEIALPDGVEATATTAKPAEVIVVLEKS